MPTSDGKSERGGDDELLRQSGIAAAVEEPDSAIRTQCLRAAQRLTRLGCVTVGLLPASGEVGVVGVGVNLALALAEITGSTVGYIDANLRWPALAPLIGADLRADGSEPSAHGASSVFHTRWLRGHVALLVPKQRGVVSGINALERALVPARELFGHCLVDLTGWQRLGEHLHAFAMLDGVIIVARAGLTTEDELLRLHAELPAGRQLGVLLLGAGGSLGL